MDGALSTVNCAAAQKRGGASRRELGAIKGPGVNKESWKNKGSGRHQRYQGIGRSFIG
jgi:hypothetical protein